MNADGVQWNTDDTDTHGSVKIRAIRVPRRDDGAVSYAFAGIAELCALCVLCGEISAYSGLTDSKTSVIPLPFPYPSDSIFSL